jgi:hypothetical protein
MSLGKVYGNTPYVAFSSIFLCTFNLKIPFLNHVVELRSPLKNNLKSQIIWNPIVIKILTHNFGGPS